MSKLFKTATMAIAASGLAFAMPASAAPALHANPNAHAAVTGDMTFEHQRDRLGTHAEILHGHNDPLKVRPCNVLVRFAPVV